MKCQKFIKTGDNQNIYFPQNRIVLNMEKHLDSVMEEVNSKPGVVGCVFADHQGLCLGAKGKASTESAGIIVAIAEQAAKLEPQSTTPIIRFENDNSSCTIQRNGLITGAIFKSNN